MAADIFGKLTSLNLDMSYEFDNLEIDMPATAGNNPQPNRWRVNGKIRISTKGGQQGRGPASNA